MGITPERALEIAEKLGITRLHHCKYRFEDECPCESLRPEPTACPSPEFYGFTSSVEKLTEFANAVIAKEFGEPVGEVFNEGAGKDAKFFESCTYGVDLPDGTKLYARKANQ